MILKIFFIWMRFILVKILLIWIKVIIFELVKEMIVFVSLEVLILRISVDFIYINKKIVIKLIG